mgnify:CR=1 FL=1
MYAAARREGWTTLALGQHLDDLAESFLMSVFHNGRLRTMKANYTVKEGDLKIIIIVHIRCNIIVSYVSLNSFLISCQTRLSQINIFKI